MADMSEQILELMKAVLDMTNRLEVTIQRLEQNVVALNQRSSRLEDSIITLSGVVTRLEQNERLILQLLQRREGGEETNGAR